MLFAFVSLMAFGYLITTVIDRFQITVRIVNDMQHYSGRCGVFDMFPYMSLLPSSFALFGAYSKHVAPCCFREHLGRSLFSLRFPPQPSSIVVGLDGFSCFACWMVSPLNTKNLCSSFVVFSSICSIGSSLSWLLCVISNLHIVCCRFDSTLGYPGEGPDTWSCISANIDSLATNPQVVTWPDDLICLQETRVADSNFRDTCCCIHSHKKEFYPGKLLDHTRQKNGVYRIPHGGVAIIGDSTRTTLFSNNDDSTGNWEGLFASTRVTGVWHQVLPKLKILCFTIYAKSWKQHTEDEIHSDNDGILAKVFEVASQYGDIPVVITGDLQAEPEAFESFQVAKQGGWSDPIACFDQDGNSNRPPTFSRSADFSSGENHCSSIDAILVNHVAASALEKVDICHGDARQHAPIRATFRWPKIFQKGHRLLQPAPLIFDHLASTQQGGFDPNKLDCIAHELWENKFASLCDVQDDNLAWEKINCFGVAILTQAGARFAPGPNPHTRGTKPVFVSKTMCPGQDSDGSAWCSKTAQLSKIHNLVSELITRLGRPCSNTADMMNQWALQQKVVSKLRKIKGFRAVVSHDNLHKDLLIAVQKKLHQLIVQAKMDLKTKRINAWKSLMQQGTASQNVAREVFQWLRNKDVVKPSNQVVDSQGNILFQPQDAIDEINAQWDSIFSANILSENPHSVLEKIWPFVEPHRKPIVLEPICGEQLRKQVLKRKTHAAPGLDGWRTKECHCLPVTFYNAVARFFQQVETKQRSLPSILTTGKQVILDKNGSPEPLQKRLICLLSVLLLAYTGARFAQLQSWMQTTLPGNLFGAIKGRYMSTIHTTLRLQIDDAKSNDQHLCGIKVDKSKCFDRIIPATTAMLFLAFGLPQGLATFFLDMYGNFKRHLAYLSWTSPTATTGTNGVVQGCSLSLIAVNLNMAVWAIMVSRIPHVVACAFIDDAYLWVQLQHCHLLSKAIDISEQWDSLSGQALNIAKCKVWGTSTKARQAVRNMFPNMKLSHIIDVLGTQIQTTEMKSYGWPEQKTQKIVRDIKNIMSLPCNRIVIEHILACKVIPQLTYAPHVNQIPKTVLTVFQNKIAKALWKSRPMWRSKPLLLGVLSKPYRVDPVISRAYNVILDVLQFLKTTSPSNRDTWLRQCNADYITPNSICALFFQACAILDITVEHGFYISVWGCDFVSLLDFARRDFKKVLQHACRQALYQHAFNPKRKDFHQPSGIIDFDLTNIGSHAVKPHQHQGIPLACFRDSVLVGCVVTNDRASHLNDKVDHRCRCCQEEKETFEHLVLQCQVLPTKVDKPPFPEACGDNFGTFGIVEISPHDVLQRLTISNTAHIPVKLWDSTIDQTREHLWTDGSCDFGHLFFHTIASFAVVDASGRLRKSGPVNHWSLSAYAAELFAVIVAFADAERPIQIHCDCRSIVDQVNSMIQNNSVPAEWSHLSWWNFLYQIWSFRKSFHSSPLEIIWIPAHVAEDCPPELVTRDIALQYNTTIWDILNNRKADYFAKLAVDAIRGKPKKEVEKHHLLISDWQVFLAKVSSFVAETQSPCDNNHVVENPNQNQHQVEPAGNVYGKVLPHNVHGALPIAVFRDLLPKWEWQLNLQEFSWKPSFEPKDKTNVYAKISKQDWDAASLFFKGLQWKCGENLQVSFLELAAQAHFLKFSFDAGCTPADVASTLRKFLNVVTNEGNASHTFPGIIVKKCKSNGKTFPSGLIQGAYPAIHHEALKSLAIPMLRGRSHQLSQWKVPFTNF